MDFQTTVGHEKQTEAGQQVTQEPPRKESKKEKKARKAREKQEAELAEQQKKNNTDFKEREAEDLVFSGAKGQDKMPSEFEETQYAVADHKFDQEIN